jgi:tetratricopeptide (TPR) repeat protein
MFHYRDWTGAESHFRRAIELDPDCVTARQWYALFHSLRGNDAEALREISRARALAPYSLSLMLDAAEMHYYARRAWAGNFENVARALRHAQKLHPNSVNIGDLLVRATWLAGDTRAAAALRGWEGSPQDFARQLAGPRRGSPEFDKVSPGESYFRARWHAALGQREEALALLERAFEAQHFFIIYLKAEPFFDSLRDEPRFLALLEKVGLDP